MKEVGHAFIVMSCVQQQYYLKLSWSSHLKVTGSLRADTRTVYLIKRYFIVFFVTKNRAV